MGQLVGETKVRNPTCYQELLPNSLKDLSLCLIFGLSCNISSLFDNLKDRVNQPSNHQRPVMKEFITNTSRSHREPLQIICVKDLKVISLDFSKYWFFKTRLLFEIVKVVHVDTSSCLNSAECLTYDT